MVAFAMAPSRCPRSGLSHRTFGIWRLKTAG